MAIEVHQADIGTVFEATVKDQGAVIVDISGASTKELKFRKPNGTVLVKPATFVTTGADGKMKYATVSGDLDLSGDWRVQGHVVIGTGNWHSDEYRFTVYKNLS